MASAAEVTSAKAGQSTRRLQGSGQQAQDRSALALDGVGVQFAGVRALHDISFSVSAGERVAVIGPNGAGKSTLFNVISGETRATAGTVHLLGRAVSQARPDQLAALGLGRTYQTSSVFRRMTVAENVQVALQGLRTMKYRSWRPLKASVLTGGRVTELIQQVELSSKADVLVGQLSHGEQRQLELALALANQPRVLLLDEPAAGLSAKERVLMRSLLENLPSEMTLLLIEHDMSLALEMVDRVVCLSNGELISDATPTDIRKDARVREVYLGGEDA